ncbi:hypothetical protein ES705_15114 [subsurface metagenome]
MSFSGVKMSVIPSFKISNKSFLFDDNRPISAPLSDDLILSQRTSAVSVATSFPINNKFRSYKASSKLLSDKVFLTKIEKILLNFFIDLTT